MRLDDQLAIDRVHQRAPHAHVAEGRHRLLVERHVLVGVSRRAMHRDARRSPSTSRYLSHGNIATRCTSPLFSWLMRVLVLAMKRNRICLIFGNSAPRQ